MKLTYLFIFCLSCAPTYTLVQRHRDVPRAQTCPTLNLYLGDFVFSATALAVSALAFNGQHYGKSMIAAGLGMGVAVGDNLAEMSCR